MAVTREARAPQPRPIVRASAKCRGNTHKIRPTRRNTEGFVVARRAPFLGVRRVPLAGRNGLLATFRPPRPAVWARFKTMNSVHLFSIFERHASLLMMRRIYNLQPYLAAHRLPPPECDAPNLAWIRESLAKTSPRIKVFDVDSQQRAEDEDESAAAGVSTDLVIDWDAAR